MKNKKYKKEIIKFCHNLEKFHDNYHYEQRLKETNISDKKKFIQNYITRIMKENKKKDKDFISNLLDFMKTLPENHFQINILKNSETETISYSISDIKIPKKIHLKTNISRMDDIWKNFKYKGLNSAQLFKRYRKIIVGTKINKNINSIKKLSNLKEIADMRAIKKLMNIPKDKDENYHAKSRIYETRKIIKPTTNNSSLSSKIKTHHHQKNVLSRNPEFLEEKIEIQSDLTLYCLCKKKYQDGEKMMACDRCEDWLHFECIGYTGEMESKFTQELKFVCPNCDEMDEEEIKKERRKEYEILFSKYYKKEKIDCYQDLLDQNLKILKEIQLFDKEENCLNEQEFTENIIEKEEGIQKKQEMKNCLDSFNNDKEFIEIEGIEENNENQKEIQVFQEINEIKEMKLTNEILDLQIDWHIEKIQENPEKSNQIDKQIKSLNDNYDSHTLEKENQPDFKKKIEKETSEYIKNNQTNQELIIKNVDKNEKISNIPRIVFRKFETGIAKLDDYENDENENLSYGNKEEKNLKENFPIEFHCITKDNLQNEPNNNFNNKKITDYFIPLIKS